MSDGYILRIHHLDFGTDGGDATILALWSGTELIQAVLIDGGSRAAGLATVSRAWNELGLSNANTTTFISTHYDDDYLAGLVDIINEGSLGSTPTVFDRGQQGNVTQPATLNTVDATCFLTFAGEQMTFARYKRALYGQYVLQGGSGNDSNWPTGNIASLPTTEASWQYGTNGSLFCPLINYGPASFSVKSLVTNSYVNQTDGTPAPATNTNGSLCPELDKSHALLVEFGSFRYYHGGAITTTQEGGTANVAQLAAPYSSNNVLALIGGGVSVAKLSRQGASTATGKNVLAALGCSVAIVTCGTGRAVASETDPFNSPSYPFTGLASVLPPGVIAYCTGETVAVPLDTQGNLIVCGAWNSSDMVAQAPANITIEIDGSSANSFSVQYDAPIDAWTESGTNKTYTTPTRYTDVYPMTKLPNPSSQGGG